MSNVGQRNGLSCQPLRRRHRGLRMEPLESRTLLSAVPTDNSFRLAIFADSAEVEVPAEVGVEADDSTRSLFTIDDGGEIYLDTPSGQTLGDFFDIWQNHAGLAGNRADAVLSEDQLFGNIEDGAKTVQMFVNGQVSTEFDQYVVQNEDEIVLVYGDNPVLSINTNYGPMVVELFEAATPITVDNFLNYVNDGDYINSFFHRSVEYSPGTDFVIQGGGHRTNSTTFTDTDQFSDVPADAPIQNEPLISNLRGTIAMAKRAGDPNSATCQFFVNMNDENATGAASLDTQNGGFTVFGQVLDMTTADEIADLDITPASAIDTTISATDASLFSSLPLGPGNQLVVVQGVAGQGEISGVRYLDWNRNGVYDSNEPALAGATVYLDADGNGILDAGEDTAVTGADGFYRFQVEAGQYIVRSEASLGRPAKGPFSPESYLVDVEIGREISNLDFGELDDTTPTLAELPAEINISAGAPVHLALDGHDVDGDALTYTVSSTNPSIGVSIPKQEAAAGNRSMRITVQGYGEMVFELFEGRAPNTTARIIEIAESGWYEGRDFHRVIDGFIIQGGSRDGSGIYGTGMQIDDEYHADLQFTTSGLLAMAKGGDDTGDSQFFVTDVPSGGFTLPRWLDFNYTIFGKLTAGDEVREAISEVQTNSAQQPSDDQGVRTPIVIESVEIFHDDQDAVMMIGAPDGTFDSGEVTVTVSDGFGGTATRTITVNVLPDTHNNNPFLGPIDPIRLAVDQPYSFQLEATDVEGDQVFYQVELLTDTDDITVEVTEDGVVTITPSNGVVGVAEIAFRVGPTAASLVPDSLGEYEEGVIDSQIITIEIPPAKPTIGFALGSDTGVQDGSTARDNSADKELYFAVRNLQATSELSVYLQGVETAYEQILRIPQGDGSADYLAVLRIPSGAELADGDYTVHVRQFLPLGSEYGNQNVVSDWSDAFEFSVDTVAPVIDSAARPFASVGEAYTYDVNSPEEGGENIFYQLQLPVPDGMVQDPVTGEITWTPNADQVGQHPIVVLIHDGAGNEGRQEYDLVVSTDGDLGVVDFLLLPDNDLGADSRSFTLETAHAGFLTFEALHSVADSVTMTLYDSSGNELVGSQSVDGGQRIDWPTDAGVSYSLELTGDASDVDLRIANLLNHDGTTVTVHGTAEADEFLFSAEHSRNITINGVAYAFSDDEVAVVTFDADRTASDPGSDVVRIEGSVLAETLTATFEGAELVPTMVFQTNPGAALPLTVTATNFEQLLAWSRSGAADTAVFEDSPGRDKGKGLPGERVSLIRSLDGYEGFYRRAKSFEEVTLVGSNNAAEDMIVFCDAPGSDHFEVNAETGDSRLVTESGVVCRASNFRKMLVRSRYAGGTDTAAFIDSGANDKFVARPGKAWLYSLVEGNEFDLIVRNFDEAVVDFLNGGYDKARFTDSFQSDHFVGRPEIGTFWGPGFHFAVRQAEEVSVTSLHTGDSDTAELYDTALDDLLRCDYDNQSRPTAQFWTPDDLGQMLFQLVDFESLDAYGTTGINKAEVDGVDFVQLHGSWTTASGSA